MSSQMIYESTNPHGPLGEWVETIFHLKDYCPEHSIERLVPDTTASLVIELDGQRRWIADNVTLKPTREFRNCWLSGPQRNHIVISALPNTELVGVRFRSAGVFPLLQKRVDEICDCVIDGDVVFGDSIRVLREQVLKPSRSTPKLELVEEWLIKKMDFDRKPPQGIADAIAAIKADPTRKRVAQIVNASGFSRKHFIDLFKKHVGLTPKEFHRILRFNQVLSSINKCETVVWTTISEDCGYFDQAHFIRDFRNFSGINPTEFIEIQDGRCNFFPVRRDG